MTILYYSWQEDTTIDILETFQSLGHDVCPIVHELPYYTSESFSIEIETQLQTESYDFIFTFNYFPTISQIANTHAIPYLSWVYDCPNLGLYSVTISNPCNYIFIFDRKLLALAKQNGALHAYHLPLAINASRISKQLGLPDSCEHFFPSTYQHDISFVGYLYERGHYTQLLQGSDHLRGYLQGIINAQKKIWGLDLISQVLTKKHVTELSAQLPIQTSPDYTYTSSDLYQSFIQKKITSDERIETLNLLSAAHSVALYTDSETSLCPNVLPMGIVDYVAGMPNVFYSSKINLNITLRSITSGIPLRAIDVMGCGGFLLSNYQPELCDFFVPDEDFVYFEDFEDMQQKVDYYLTHETEREEIAYHGYCKASQQFSYSMQVSKMLSLVFRPART